MIPYKPSWSYPTGPTPPPPITGAGAGTNKPDPVNPQTGKVWTVAEKLLGLANQGADVWGKYKNPQVISTGGGTPDTPASETFLGMPKTIGIIVTVIGGLVAGIIVYKLVAKK
jgi:hypothetical protein